MLRYKISNVSHFAEGLIDHTLIRLLSQVLQESVFFCRDFSLIRSENFAFMITLQILQLNMLHVKLFVITTADLRCLLIIKSETSYMASEMLMILVSHGVIL